MANIHFYKHFLMTANSTDETFSYIYFIGLGREYAHIKDCYILMSRRTFGR